MYGKVREEDEGGLYLAVQAAMVDFEIISWVTVWYTCVCGDIVKQNKTVHCSTERQTGVCDQALLCAFSCCMPSRTYITPHASSLSDLLGASLVNALLCLLPLLTLLAIKIAP